MEGVANAFRQFDGTCNSPTRRLYRPRWTAPQSTDFALRFVLGNRIGIPHENQPNFLAEAEQVSAPREQGPKAEEGRGLRGQGTGNKASS